MTPITILIIDDNEDDRFYLSHLLTKNGYIVHMASTGQEGYLKAIDLNPQLILMDIMLEGGNIGFEFAKRIKEVLTVPILYISSLIVGHSVEIAIRKPVEPTEFFKILEKHLRQAGLQPPSRATH